MEFLLSTITLRVEFRKAGSSGIHLWIIVEKKDPLTVDQVWTDLYTMYRSSI
jgi:hypothetical protein